MEKKLEGHLLKTYSIQMWYWNKIFLKRDQRNRTESIELDPHLHGQLILDKDTEALNVEQVDYSANNYPCGEKMKLNSNLTQ